MTLNCREWLQRELAERKRKNPSYSLQAFSKALGLSAPSLSQILSGKRPMSRKAALRVISRCSLGPEDARHFLASALGVTIDEAAVDDGDARDFERLDLDRFRLMSNWYYFAVLSLGDVKPNSSSPAWIAERLGISTGQAAEAYAVLKRLGFLRPRGRGFSQCEQSLSVPTQRCDSALRRYHGQTLSKALEALHADEVQLEYFSAVTMAVDEVNLPAARELIKEFRRKLSRLVQIGRQQRIYTLAIQLFPVSRA